MWFSWLKDRRRRRLLDQPLPEAWKRYIASNVAIYHWLSESEQAKLLDDSRIFIAEKNWEGCGGLEMTEEIQVTIAAQACLLTLGFDGEHFDRVRSILVYPSAYVVPTQRPIGSHMLIEMLQDRLGESHYRGPVILAWNEALSAGREPGHGINIVFHEFAHQLDMLDGESNGTPVLPADQIERWRQVMSREYKELRRARGSDTLLDPYGATNEAEFFAVATECFFDRPLDLEAEHGELYELLCDYYRQDPAERWRKSGLR
jgi:Mlc titration factor MtfA (ptsG expression regulator)